MSCVRGKLQYVLAKIFLARHSQWKRGNTGMKYFADLWGSRRTRRACRHRHMGKESIRKTQQRDEPAVSPSAGPVFSIVVQPNEDLQLWEPSGSTFSVCRVNRERWTSSIAVLRMSFHPAHAECLGSVSGCSLLRSEFDTAERRVHRAHRQGTLCV